MTNFTLVKNFNLAKNFNLVNFMLLTDGFTKPSVYCVLELDQLLELGSPELDNAIHLDRLGAAHAEAMQGCDQGPRQVNNVLIHA